MSETFRMLVWKEWRERRGQLVICLIPAGLALVAAVVFWCGQLLWGKEPDRFVWEELGWLYITLVPLFVAMRTACGEATDRTRSFSFGLPISPRRASSIRLAGGALTLLAPIALVVTLAAAGLLLVRLISPGDPAPDASPLNLIPVSWPQLCVVLTTAALFAVAAVGNYVQMSMLGTFSRSENHLAFWGAVWTIVMTFSAVLIIGKLNKQWQEITVLETVSSQALSFNGMISGQVRGDAFESPQRWVAMSGNLITSLLLALWFVSRHSRRIQPIDRLSLWERGRTRLSRLLPRWCPQLLQPIRATRFGALAWLGARQALPMCVAALGIALVISLVLSVLWRSEMDKANGDRPWQAAAVQWAMLTAMVGILWASVAGVGSVADELDPRSGDFWRTRPIPFWRLFTVKFLASLVVVLLVLNGPLMLFATVHQIDAEQPGNAGAWVYAACWMPFHGVMFAIAVAWACVLRRVAVAAMAAIGSVFVVMVASLAIPALELFGPQAIFQELARDARSRGGSVDLTSCGYPAMLAVVCLAIVGAYLIAGYALSAYQPRSRLEPGAVIHRFPGPRRFLRLRRSA